jgi:4-amino-4-deoxy-L-arabinose transferase-like glycosyltransferase
VRGRLSSFNWALIGIAAAGVAIRLLYVYVLSPDVKGVGDWYYFHWGANLLASGHGFIEPFTYTYFGQSFPSASHPPLWMVLLSGVSELGFTHPHAHRAVGAVVGGGTIIALGLLGRRVAGERVGIVAAVIGAAYPLFIAADGSLMSESLYGLLVALTLLGAYRLHDRGTTASAALLGLAIGFACLVRTEALLFLPLLVIPVAWRLGRDRVRNILVAGLAALVVLTPWTVRNWTTFGRPVLISTNGPAALAGANCGATYSGPDLGYWRLDCIGFTQKDVHNEAKASPRFTRKAVRYASHHVGQLPKVMLVRLLRTWDLWQPRRMIDFAEGRSHNAERAGLVVYYLLVPLALWGVVVLRRRHQPLWILVMPAVMVSIVSIGWYGIPRFRHAAEISIVVLGAVSIADLAPRLARLWRRWRGRDRPTAVAGAARP